MYKSVVPPLAAVHGTAAIVNMNFDQLAGPMPWEGRKAGGGWVKLQKKGVGQKLLRREQRG